MEFSKKLIIWLILFCLLGIAASYTLAFFEKEINEAVTVALITTVMGSCVSYLIYQFKLKNSRNKYHVDNNGVPFN
jgi:flagellar motor component MotA